MNNKGISTKLAVVAIFLIVVFFVAAYYFLYFPITAPYRPFGVTITPTIYSIENNIGVLNEMSTFEIYIWNEGPSPINVEIVLTVDDELITNKTFSIDLGSSRNETLSQRLSDVGMWKVRAISEDEEIESYSFKTLTNKNEADLEIGELQNERDRRRNEFISLILEIIGTIVLVAGAIAGVYKYFKKKHSTPKKNK